MGATAMHFIPVTTAAALALGVAILCIRFGTITTDNYAVGCQISNNNLRGCSTHNRFTLDVSVMAYTHPYLIADQSERLQVGNGGCSHPGAYKMCPAYVHDSCDTRSTIWIFWILFLTIQFALAVIAMGLARTAEPAKPQPKMMFLVGSALLLASIAALGLTIATFVLNYEVIRGCNTVGSVPVEGMDAVMQTFQSLSSVTGVPFALFIACIACTVSSIALVGRALLPPAGGKGGFSALSESFL